MDELERRKHLLNAALNEVKRDQKKAKKEAATAGRIWRLKEPIRRAALAMYSLAGYNVEPAMRYLHACQRQHHWPAKSDDEVARIVEDLFLAADEAEVDALVDTENPLDATALRCALRYVEEWAVVVDSRRLNTHRGIAPSSEAVLEQLESNRQKAPQLLRGPPRSFGGW